MLTWSLLALGVALILLDIIVPSSGLLSGVGIALFVERGLNALGVGDAIRIPLAGIGMLITVGMAIRFGERLSERLFPARIRTNVDRLVGQRAEVHSQAGAKIVILLEGDLWTARLAEGAQAVERGDEVEIVALTDQVPVIRKRGEEAP
ncbi:hypothetical protein KKF91_08865 [Myxococcota bacterium]|nr:hypothetical protein [Myxococcota bacterium]MBU1430652.1 hypothetical protein [Myxococcota bacterium]MBU1899263.1 hypothetical protein [Myxococcota bacterium]